jgi:asparagine synthase (glutamine-hydrolysing)
MCGIYGTYGGSPAVAEALGRDMVNRGPDGQGIAVIGGAAIGMNRLHLWGDPTSDLPFRMHDGFAALNGELYGRLAPDGTVERYIENTTGGEGEVRFFRSQTPPGALDGMYCVAELDARSGDVRLSRDRFGIKPVFYGLHPENGLVFASCIRSLFLPEAGFVRELHADSLIDSYAFGFSLSGQTPYVGIHELMPGCEMVVGADGARLSEPEQLTGARRATPPDISAVRRQMRRAVLSCANTEYPLGLAVSGGIDSTILAHELNAAGVENVTTFSVVLEEAGDGVVSLDQLGLPRDGVWKTWKHRHVVITKENFTSHMQGIVGRFSLPTDMHSMPLYSALAQIVADEGIRVLLTGEGADEYFMGYEKYRQYAGPRSLASYYLSGQKGAFIRELFDADIVDKADDRAERFGQTVGGNDFMDRLRALEIRARLHKLLLRTDVVLMEYGIEGRTPFLHGGLPELALASTASSLIGSHGKQVLRDAYAAEIQGLSTRPKRRFKAPEKLFWDVFQSSEVQDVLFAPCRGDGFDLSAAKVARILDGYGTGEQSDLSELLFLIFTTKQAMETP